MKGLGVLVVVAAAIAFLAIPEFRSALDPDGPAPADGKLSALTIAADHSMTGYDRGEFIHWIDATPSCTVREVVLARQSDGGEIDCRDLNPGEWTSPYDGVRVTSVKAVDVDHTVPLAEAWRSGADEWTPERRKQYANDLRPGFLVAASPASNRSKGDQDPAHWMPPAPVDPAYPCVYARNWIAVKTAYGLTVDQQEHDALARVLSEHCPA